MKFCFLVSKEITLKCTPAEPLILALNQFATLSRFYISLFLYLTFIYVPLSFPFPVSVIACSNACSWINWLILLEHAPGHLGKCRHIFFPSQFFKSLINLNCTEHKQFCFLSLKLMITRIHLEQKLSTLFQSMLF